MIKYSLLALGAVAASAVVVFAPSVAQQQRRSDKGMETIDTGLPALKVPFEWATRGGNTVYTSHIPVRVDGSIETGDMTKQAELMFGNLQKSLEAAGGGLTDVTQLLFFLTSVEDISKLNEVYQRFFSKPFPNRATMIVSALAVPNMRVEVVAYAHIPR